MRRRVLRFIVCAFAIVSTPAMAAADPEFHNVMWQHQDGAKTETTRVILVYGSDQLAVWPDIKPSKQTDPLLLLPYAQIATAEYTFGKSPNVAAAVLISPLFLLSPNKHNWLTIKLKSGDFALLELDGDNYKLVMAELEKRSHVSIQTIGENK